MDSSQVGSIIAGVGGKENIANITHCVTRVRFVVKNNDSVDVDGIKAVPGVLDCLFSSGQYQVVVTITGVQGTNTTEDDANAKLAEADKAFGNAPKSAGILDVMNKLQDVRFTQDDAGKTYVYLVDEKLPVDENGIERADDDSTLDGFQYQGVTYDQSEYRVEIAVTDNGESVLTATTTITKVKDKDGKAASEQIGSYTEKNKLVSIPFENAYSAKSVTVDTSADVALKKVLAGRTWAQGDEFGFTISNKTKPSNVATAPMPNGSTVTVDQTDALNNEASFNFGTLTFDTVGTYVYEVRETVPENATNPKVNDGQTQYKDAGDKWGETGWTLNGITYDNHVATITIKIADPGNGQLNKDVSVAGATFTNRYSAATGTDGSAVFKASKMLEGRNMVDDEFDFSVNLRKADGSGIGKEVFAGSNTKADNGVASGISFDSGVFTYTTDSLKELVSEGYATPGADGKSWTVYYVVAEETGEGALPEGVTPKDNVSSYNFTVTVTDDGDGKLTAMLGTDAQNIEFKNQYAATHPATYAITVEKQLTNRNMKAGEFDFYLKGVASENKLVDVASGTNAAGIEVAGANSTWSAPVNFGAASDGKYAFSFTQAMLEQAEEDGYAHAERTGIETTWTVNYKLYEDATAGNLPGGVTPVTSSFDLTFKVKDDGAGKLEVTSFTRADEPSAQDPSMTFTFKNAYDTTYDGSDVTANAKFTKVLDGRDWKDSDNFTFTIEGKDGAPLPVDEKSNPVSEVTVNEATAKDFSFGTFKYTLDDVKNEPNREKEFIYTVSEKEPAKGAISGVAYDKHPATLKIKVKDDGSGKLVATATVENGTFTNVYTSTVDLSAKLPIELRKTLTNRGMTDGQFAFTVTPLAGENGSPTADEVKDKLGLKDDAYEAKATELGGTSVIDLLGKDVTFTNDDAGKTYAFEVNETFPATDADGYTKDPNEAVVTIKPTYAADSGILTVEVTVKKGDEAKTDFITSDDSAKQAIVIPFVNSYDASTDPDKGGAKATVAVKKTLTGRPMTAGEFAFNVTTKGRNGGETTVKQGVKNAADGTVDFGEFGYTIEELNKAFDEGWADRTVDPTSKNATWTLHYTASEVTDGLSNGVSPKHASFDFDIVVVDNGNGSLTATYKPGAEAYFENAYSTDNAAASIDLAGSKILTGRALNADEFSFTATPLDGAPALEKADAKNDASGNVNFGTINFTLDDLNKAPDGAEAETKAEDADKTAEETTDETTDEAQAREGAVRSHTFYYEVTEQNNGLPGITYDQAATKKVGITVTDDGQGHLTAKLADGATKAFTFTNSYDVTSTPSTPTGKGGLTVTKTLIGRDMTADDKFTFELVDEAGNVVSTGTSPVAKDGEAATIEMTPVTFTGRGSRTQNFTLREVKGDKGGVAYDGATYPVAANVVDNGDGTLSVTWSTTADKIAFTNSYSTADTTLGIVAAKMLAGRDLKDGEFSFKLQQVGTKDNKSWTAKNDANGQVTFPVLTFVDPGLYEFEISEVKGDEKNVSYDETIYKVNVAVTDDGNGHLTAQATYVDGDPVFKNTYTKPAEPAPTPEPTPEPEPAPTPEPEEPKAPELPKTGDDSMLPIAAAVVAGAVCIGGGLVLSRRRK